MLNEHKYGAQSISVTCVSCMCAFCLLFLESEIRYSTWKKAVMKSMGWVTTESSQSGNYVFILIVAVLFWYVK